MMPTPHNRFGRLLPAALVLAALAFALALLPTAPARADEGWVINSFDAGYTINEDGTITASEDIRVDFGSLQKHGIFRDIPVEYKYDDQNNRLIRLTDISVDDGSKPWKFEELDNGINKRLKIGDPDVLVSGPQRYRIRYTINRDLNPFADHDEFYWNVTGNEWPVRIESASATVIYPGTAQIACYQGPKDSTTPCESDTLATGEGAVFGAKGTLPEASGLTIVVGLTKGAVAVGAPELVDANKTFGEQARDFIGLSPVPIAVSLALLVAGVVLVLRQWWIAGRDRWYGDMFHVADTSKSTIKPLGGHESIVTEFTPPELDGARPRRLRPAEVGLLVDESADTLDVTATIVDLAVQKRLVIKETEEGGVFGLFKKKDYVLEKLDAPESGLIDYEQKLLDALFDEGTTVKLSDLKNKFYKDLGEVKEKLYREVTKELKFFPRSPDTTRTIYQVAAAVTIGLGIALTYGLGVVFGVAIIGVPIVIAGIFVLCLAGAMPRRTADGRVMYRRCLGFRRYIETAETARQEFAEKANLFAEYLPYAIVFQCVHKWAKAFEGLGAEATQPGWYYGRGPFMAAAFASNLNDFSESISSVMASTPGGSGGSGFGGGGFSGGGGGGGGGGSW